jgi:hypothetical protein
MTPAQNIEKIYRVWSSRRDEQIAVRIQYSVSETDGCRVFTVGHRDEWL